MYAKIQGLTSFSQMFSQVTRDVGMCFRSSGPVCTYKHVSVQPWEVGVQGASIYPLNLLDFFLRSCEPWTKSSTAWFACTVTCIHLPWKYILSTIRKNFMAEFFCMVLPVNASWHFKGILVICFNRDQVAFTRTRSDFMGTTLNLHLLAESEAFDSTWGR